MEKRKKPDDTSRFNSISIGCKDVIPWAACLEFRRMESIRRNPIQTVLLQIVLPVRRFGRLEKLGLLRQYFLYEIQKYFRLSNEYGEYARKFEVH
jgi:hypothetical protein